MSEKDFKSETTNLPKTIVQTAFGGDENYAPFSNLYAKFMREVVDASELDETLFMRVLEKLGVIQRRGGKSLPPHSVFDRMHGQEGEAKVDFYCKKQSIVAKAYTENFGICMSSLAAFDKQYGQTIITSLNLLNEAIVEERIEADEWVEIKLNNKEKSKGKIGAIRKKGNALFASGRTSVIDAFFKG